jgi:flagellar biosynthesis/type III secretory pathway ATPase
VFALLPRLLERSGQGENGAITAVYTVLVEGSDMDEPIADEVRGILDGHIVLDRQIAARGHYPAVDAVASLSRVMEQVVSPAHLQAARSVRSALALYEQKRDLIALGAYEKGSDARLDRTLLVLAELERFLCQDAMHSEPLEDTQRELLRLAKKLE